MRLPRTGTGGGRTEDYSERRKLRRCCFEYSLSVLKPGMGGTAVGLPVIDMLASDALYVASAKLLRARIAWIRSVVRPSCTKKIRLPSPQSGAVRNSSPLA